MTEIEEQPAQAGFPELDENETRRVLRATTRQDMHCSVEDREAASSPRPSSATLDRLVVGDGWARRRPQPRRRDSALLARRARVVAARPRQPARATSRRRWRRPTAASPSIATSAGRRAASSGIASMVMAFVYPSSSRCSRRACAGSRSRSPGARGCATRASRIDAVRDPSRSQGSDAPRQRRRALGRAPAREAAARASGAVANEPAPAWTTMSARAPAASRCSRSWSRSAILALVSVLIYGAFDGMSRGKKSLGRVERSLPPGARRARAHDAASSRAPSSRCTSRSPQRADPAAHHLRRHERLARRSRRLHLVLAPPPRAGRARERSERALATSLAGSRTAGKMDLVRREATMIDLEPKQGRRRQRARRGHRAFELAYLDPITGQWTETWDIDAGDRAAQAACRSR